MPTGTIARLLIDKGFGFIRDEGGVGALLPPQRRPRRGVRAAARRPARGVRARRIRQGPPGGRRPPDRELNAASGIPGPASGPGARCPSPARRSASTMHPRKRTGPGGPPGLQNRLLPACRGGWVRLPGASATLAPVAVRLSRHLSTVQRLSQERQHRPVSLKSSNTTSARVLERFDRVLAGRDGDDSRAVRVRARDVARRVADDHDRVASTCRGRPQCPRAVERHGHEMVAIVRVLAECAAAEVAPQVEVPELHFRRIGVSCR